DSKKDAFASTRLTSQFPNSGSEIHIKDSTFLGNGLIDYPSILKAAKKAGSKYYMVKQSYFQNSSPMRDILKNAEYMKNISIG
ncbi:MAG: hypothetical protein ACRCVT_00215, partial [Leadbetterella sp.]